MWDDAGRVERTPYRWDDLVQTGEREGYSWVVSRREGLDWPDIIVTAHLGLRLCITAFDGGPIRPGPDERSAGWTMQGDVMISPPLTEGLHVPNDGYDEWYILAEPAFDALELERFVNYGGFTLADVEEMVRSLAPTWDKHGLDFLVPIQDRFWAQLRRVAPVTYVAIGDRDVAVSQNARLIERLVST
jgi:hypothetical protein